MKHIELVMALLLLLGGLNWGLIGLFDFDLIEYIFERTWIDRLLYILIGVSALYKVVKWQASKQK